MKRIGIMAFREALDIHLDRVETEGSELVITRRGCPDLVILPRSELEGLKTTRRILESPVDAERLRRSIAELDAGLGQQHDVIEP
ncbi:MULTISPECIES: type II toxin-antitoxin system Phd/YefM family antitoxin [Methylobacterium]|uniref:Antitoxin n=1 Tax=Methylobacterium thuringiense TaxID=1003091 RepID=A0ABQ4TRN3_9HYPH|nr:MULTISPECIES: type II toxin-antitoxin system Phd/YefM family antitoxin [Methylobacterium]TXN20682.1 type II toxin-antitoxin system Phd/YefM family antitoxin [Methylobacterium sp. WL9]GJE56543.1 Antitoxin YefM [Methylobacterium thuringiense]